MSFGLLLDPLINTIAAAAKEKTTEYRNNITSELKNDYSQIAYKLDEFAGKPGTQPKNPIKTPTELNFPPFPRVTTSLGKRIEDLNENIKAPVVSSDTKGTEQSGWQMDGPAALVEFPAKMKTSMGERVENLKGGVLLAEASADFLLSMAAKELTGDSNEHLKLITAALSRIIETKREIKGVVNEIEKNLTQKLAGLNIHPSGDDIKAMAFLILARAVKQAAPDKKIVEPVVESIIAIYKTISFFSDKVRQIADLEAKFIDEIAKIASVNIKSAAAFTEDKTARVTSVLVGFLANELGLGKLSGKVESIIGTLSQKTDFSLSYLIKGVLALMSTLEQRLEPKAEAVFGKQPVKAGHQGAEVAAAMIQEGPAGAWGVLRDISKETIEKAKKQFSGLTAGAGSQAQSPDLFRQQGEAAVNLMFDMEEKLDKAGKGENTEINTIGAVFDAVELAALFVSNPTLYITILPPMARKMADSAFETLAQLGIIDKNTFSGGLVSQFSKDLNNGIAGEAVREVMKSNAKEMMKGAINTGIESAKTAGKNGANLGKISAYILADIGKDIAAKITPVIKIDAEILEIIVKSVVENPVVRVEAEIMALICKSLVDTVKKNPVVRIDALILSAIVKNIAEVLKLDAGIIEASVKDILKRISDTGAGKGSIIANTPAGRDALANVAAIIYEVMSGLADVENFIKKQQ
jgi:hypothetical protein